MIRSQTELRQQRACVGARERRPRHQLVYEHRVVGIRRALLADCADHGTSPDQAFTFGERHIAEEHSQERRLAGAVRSDDRQPLARRQVEVDEPRTERSAAGDSARELEH